MWIGDYAMPMIGHDAHRVQQNAGLLRRQRQAVPRDLIRLAVGVSKN
jgi:O-acetylhomoserine/O-acetylserine sulfhydrylase-like pyridoxal-dependent enzyme